jgi:hypothetical protein
MFRTPRVLSEVEAKRTYKLARIYARISQVCFPCCCRNFIRILSAYGPRVAPDLSPRLPPKLPPKPESFVEQLVGNLPFITVVISSLTFVLSSLSTASTMLLGWRAERRESEEFKLKIKQLELQLQEAEAKVISPTSAPGRAFKGFVDLVVCRVGPSRPMLQGAPRRHTHVRRQLSFLKTSTACSRRQR